MRKLSTVYKSLMLGLLLIALDQVTKGLAQALLPGRIIRFSAHWGLTYHTNPGIWLNNHLAPGWFPVIRLAALTLWIGALFYARFYERHYRKSGLVAWAVAFLTGAVFGNVFIDRVAFGCVRDFIVNPIAVSNLADTYSTFMAGCIVIEFAVFPGARKLLRWQPAARQRREAKMFMRFVAHNVRQCLGAKRREG